METLLDSSELQVCDILREMPLVGPTQAPRTVSEVGVRRAVLEDLALKILYVSGPFSLIELSKQIRLSFDVVNELFCRLRAEMLCQVTGMSGNIPFIAITSQGRARAHSLLNQSQYAGAAPVSLKSYVEQVQIQSAKNVSVSPAAVSQAFSHLVIEDATLRKFGVAVNSNASIFLYGPPGVGKTTVAETLGRVIAEDHVWIPYALEVDGQIITVYDPSLHRSVPDLEMKDWDERWVLCQRPAVLVGGELTIEMLDLQFNPVSNFYAGPVQMKANNGVLIIDDFGRQRLRPDDLLNRWVVPLDRRIDYLTLSGGMKIEIPFEVLVVFASNIDPFKLVDGAFLRRIQTKIKLGAVSDEQFCEIFRRVAQERDIEYDPAVAGDLIAFIKDVLKQDLRSCYPRDIVNQICWGAKYEGRKPRLDHESAKLAIEAYFLAND